MQIHQDPNAQGWEKMADSGWWFSNSVSIASTLSMLIPTMGAMKVGSLIGKGIGASKGMKAVRRAAGFAEEMGTKGKWMTNGVSQAVLSRNIENWMEAHGTYKDYKARKIGEINKETGEKYTEEEANKLASTAASDNWKKGWAMLLQDIPQFLAIAKVFDPISKKMVRSINSASEKGLTSKIKPWQAKTKAAASTFFGEGAEESYQYLISENAKLKTDLDSGYITQEQYDKKMSEAYGSEEMMTSAFFGGLGGNLFQAAGSSINDVFKSKDTKEYESKLGEFYTKSITNNAKQVSLMFQHLNSADQKENPKEFRDMTINESMLNLTAQALEAGKFEQFYETIGLVSEMSEEDLKNFEETTNQEFSPDLAKEHAPKIQKKALEMRDKYLKHRNNHNSVTSSRLVKLEMNNESISDIVNSKIKEVESIKENIGKEFDMNATDRLKKRISIRERGQVLEKRRIALNKRLRLEESPIKKEFINSAIENNNILIKEQKAEAYQQKLDTKNRTANEKQIDNQRVDSDKAAEKIYNKLHKEDILRSLDVAAQGREQIIINNEDMAFSKSPEGKDAQKSEKIRKQAESYDAIKDTSEAKKAIDEAIQEIPKNNNIPDKDKEALTDSLKKKKEKITKKEQDEEKKERNNKDKQELEKINDKKNDDTLLPESNSVQDVVDVIEDYNSTEEIRFEEKLQEKQEKDTVNKNSNGKSISLLDGVGQSNEKIKDITSAAYDNWINNGKKKIGEKVRYKISKRGAHKNSKSKHPLAVKGRKAVRDFDEAFTTGEKIPQNVYDNLPIQVFIGEGESIWTRMSSYPWKDNPSKEDVERYENNYAAERKAIIDSLYKGITPETTVKHTSGGQLVTQVDENGVVAENNIKDIKQVKDSGEDPRIVYSNVFGELMEMDKKTNVVGFKAFSVGKDKDGNIMPYRGGLFLMLKKADGTLFPTRLNFLKNTPEQAEVLANLLLDVSVPESKGSSKKNELDDDLGMVGEETISKIKEFMPNEFKFLKYPTINDLLNMFTYVSENTKGLSSQLYIKGGKLHFGSGENKSVVSTENREQMKTALIDFLTNVKRRQLSIKMWNDTSKYPGYRDFVLDNKIINTNVVTGDERAFQRGSYEDKDGNTKVRYVKAFAAPIANYTAPERKEVVTSTNDITDHSSIIKEEDGPSEVELNKAYEKAIPGKNYGLGIKDGAVNVFNTKVPEEDMIILNDIREKMSLKNSEQQPTEQGGGTVNIYAGTNENTELSNFANRPFSYKGREYKNVEQAFQHQKLMTSAPNGVSSNYLNNEVGQKILAAKTGAEAKKLGRQIKKLNTIAWDRISTSIMKDLITASFEQNPGSLKRLLETGSAKLTHDQDKGKWGELFPKILTEVRQELNGYQPTQQDSEVDQKADINARRKVALDSLYQYGFNEPGVLRYAWVVDLNNYSKDYNKTEADYWKNKPLAYNTDKNIAIDKVNAKYDAELEALETQQDSEVEFKKVYHHTSVSLQNFNFGNFQRGKNQVSQFGDGLNAATETNEFFTKRYGQPIEGEVNDKDFVEIDTNLSESEIYDYLIGLGYKINTPQYKSGKYNSKSAKEEYDDVDPANDNPAVINLFNDFQQSNPDVKGVKVVNHIIGDSKVKPFYVIYDAKSFYGPGSLSKQPTPQSSVAQISETKIRKKEDKSLVSQPGKKRQRNQRKRYTSGASKNIVPKTSVKQKNIKKEDDTGNIIKDCNGVF
jgi:ribA/ribD-fused uncharacterized protein